MPDNVAVALVVTASVAGIIAMSVLVRGIWIMSAPHWRKWRSHSQSRVESSVDTVQIRLDDERGKIAQLLGVSVVAWDFTKLYGHETYFDFWIALRNRSVYRVNLNSLEGFMSLDGNECGRSPALADSIGIVERTNTPPQIRIRQSVEGGLAYRIWSKLESRDVVEVNMNAIRLKLQLTRPDGESSGEHKLSLGGSYVVKLDDGHVYWRDG